MSSITEQFSAATKSQLEAQFNIFNTFASTAVDSAEKLIALNINTTKASVEKSSAAAKKLLSVTDPKEFLTLSSAQPPSFDGLLAYSRELYSIATTAQNELIQSAQSTLKQVSALTAAKVQAVSNKVTPPALTAAVTAAVTAVNEPVAEAVTAAVTEAPKVPKAKPLAAPIEVPEEDSFIEVKADVKPSFPAPPKAIALAPEDKPAKAAAKAAPKAKK